MKTMTSSVPGPEPRNGAAHQIKKHWEPPRDTKQWFPKTRSRDRGLVFGTDRYAGDTVAFVIALALTFYVYLQFAICTGLSPRYFVLAVLVQVVLALVAHWGLGSEAVIGAELELIEPGSAHAEHLRQCIGWLKRWTRACAVLLIWSFALLEVFLFARLAPPATPLAVLFAVALSCALAAWVHSAATGYFVFETCRRVSSWWKRGRAFKSPNYDKHPSFIKRHRRHIFTSKTKLVAGTIPPHELMLLSGENGEFTFCLQTWGLLMNREVNSLLALQSSSDQRAILRRECVRVQLEILRSEPLGAVDSNDDENPPSEPPGSQPSLIPPKPPTAFMPSTAAARSAATALIVTALSLSLGGCVKKPTDSDSQAITIDVVLDTPGQSAALPQELIDVLSQGFHGHTAVTTAQVNILPAGDLAQAISCRVNESDAPWERRLVGGTMAPHEFTRVLRAKLADVQFTKEFAATAEDTENLLGKIADRLSDTETDRVPVLVFNPSAPTEGTNEVGRCIVIACKTAETTISALQQSLASGNRHLVLAYGIEPTALTPIVAAPQAPAEEPGHPEDNAEASSQRQSGELSEEDKRQLVQIPGTTVIVNTPTGQKPTIAVHRPEKYQLIGEPILFEHDSSKLTLPAWNVIEAIAAELKRTGRNRVTLEAGADPAGGERVNADLADRRGRAVQAAFLKRGIVVESLLSIGESHAPDETKEQDRAQFRAVRVYTPEAASVVSTRD